MVESGPAPRVIVGMPVRNGGRHLQQAIDSVLAQDLPDFRLVIADNGSTDATPAIVENAAVADGRVVYRRFDEVVDAAGNFNRLLEFASADYFIWMAHDDVWEPALLRRLVDALEACPAAALAYPSLDLVDENLIKVRDFPLIGELALFRPRWRRLAAFVSAREDNGKANLIHGLLRAEVARDSHGFHSYTRGAWGQDYHLLFKFAAAGPFAHAHELLFHKRVSKPDELPPLRERLAYVFAYLRISRQLRLAPFEVAAVTIGVAASTFQVLRDRLGLHFSFGHAVRSLRRRLLSTPFK